MRKILLAIGPSAEKGGAQKVFFDHIRELLKRDCSIVLVLPNDQSVEAVQCLNVKTYIVNFNSTTALIKIAMILHKEKVDIVNTYLIKSSLLFCLANLFYRRTICCTLLNAIIHEKTTKIQKVIYPFLYLLLSKICDGIIVNSDQNRDHFIQTAKIPAKLIKVIYSGIDMSEFVTVHMQKKENNRFILGIIGRLSPEKGHSCLIEALSLLKGIDYECMIVGDGPLRIELEQQVSSYGIQDRVKFYGYQNAIAFLMQQMDVIIVPSVNETFGITIVEAFASKKVVIASNAGGIPELVKDHSTGYLFPAKDSLALADRISYVYNNKSESDKIVKTAYNFAMQNYTSSIMTANTLAHYDFLNKTHNRGV